MANNKSLHDKEMASRMKKEGVERRTGRCPICYSLIPNGLFAESKNYVHITAACSGPRRKGSRT